MTAQTRKQLTQEFTGTCRIRGQLKHFILDSLMRAYIKDPKILQPSTDNQPTLKAENQNPTAESPTPQAAKDSKTTWAERRAAFDART